LRDEKRAFSKSNGKDKGKGMEEECYGTFFVENRGFSLRISFDLG
jgi:hypothetical protein